MRLLSPALALSLFAWGGGHELADAAAYTAMPNPPPERTRTLRSADDDTVGWLVLDWTGEAAPIDQWAENMIAVGREGVTEFNRTERIAAERASIERQRDAAKGYGMMRISLRSSLSEYDAGYGEFYVNAFTPGAGVAFKPFTERRPNPLSRGVSVSFVNADEAFVLPMEAGEAEALVSRLRARRNVTVDMELMIEDVNLGADRAEIVARITEYSLFSAERGASRALKTVTLTD